MAADHIQAKQRMVNFSSQKIREEGLEELNAIVNHIHRLMERMKVARRGNAMDLQRKLQREEDGRHAAEAVAAQLRTAMEESQSEIQLLRAQLSAVGAARLLQCPSINGGSDNSDTEFQS